ncbi:hypothetical protein [Alteribacter aurantiacus]|uniref:hypothetical protein n=1 Tax=Alteribacter aurantiacus TaxID=254410 RepID=UPI00040F0038|nr:hypothetical protein [Alteribacter aurantiacus]
MNAVKTNFSLIDLAYEFFSIAILVAIILVIVFLIRSAKERNRQLKEMETKINRLVEQQSESHTNEGSKS